MKTCWLRHLKAGGSLDDEPEKVCEFGCLPPRMPVEEFLGLHPVPQPTKSHPHDEHFKPFKDVWGKTEYYSDMSHCPSVRNGKTVKKKLKATISEGTVRLSSSTSGYCHQVFFDGGCGSWLNGNNGWWWWWYCGCRPKGFSPI